MGVEGAPLRLFGVDIYHTAAHADPLITLDLEVYRKRLDSYPVRSFQLERGDIHYARWGKKSEYYQKPKERGLVATAAGQPVRREPPVTYEEVQTEGGIFRLPNFGTEGLYKVFETVAKPLYHQLAQLGVARFCPLGGTRVELELEAPKAKGLDLHRVLIGNIDLTELKRNGSSKTIDRFGFNPRSTVRDYCPDWRPAVESGVKGAPYAWLLARGASEDEGVFIQSESWGVERAILTRLSKKKLVVDLISFERIVPVWRATLKIPKPIRELSSA